MDVYPLIMEPSFRSGQSTPWGGRALHDRYGKNTPDGITGESLEVSALPGLESRVANGPCRGETLRGMQALWGEKLTGKKEAEFPLMLKLLDTQQCLSVQVHPDDSYARQHGEKNGKSEAWYILDAAPGARLVYGVDTRGEDLRSVLENGRLEECLHWVEVRPGDVFHIPGGTVHALGPGIQCYEIQQSSDVTYRLWDWNRIGKDGKPRALHIEQALAVARTDRIPEPRKGERAGSAGGTGVLLVEDPHFRLYAADLDGTFPLEAGRMQFVTPMASCTLHWGGENAELAAYRSALIPAGAENVRLSGKGRVLISCA